MICVDLVSNVSSSFSLSSPSHHSYLAAWCMFYILLCFLNPLLLPSAFRKPFGTTFSSDIHAGRCASVLFFPLTYFLSRLCPEPLFKSGAASATNSLSSSFIVDKYIGIHSRIIPEHFYLTLRTSSRGFKYARSWKHACVMLVKQGAHLRCEKMRKKKLTFWLL